MGALLDNPSAVHDEDDIGVDHGRQPVRDGNGGATVGCRIQRLLHHALRHRIERAGRLVQDQHGRVLQQHPGDRDPLFLPAAQPITPFTHDSVVAVGERHDGLVDVGCLRRRLQLGLLGIRLRIAQVFGDGRVKKVGLLADDADAAHQIFLLQVTHIRTGKFHRAG